MVVDARHAHGYQLINNLETVISSCVPNVRPSRPHALLIPAATLQYTVEAQPQQSFFVKYPTFAEVSVILKASSQFIRSV